MNATVVSKKKYDAIRPYAIVGWLVTEKGYKPEELDNISTFQILILQDEFEKFIKEKMNKTEV